MKILVTGGAGMIGSNLVKRLVTEGHNVSVVDNLWRGKVQNLYHHAFPVIDLKKQFFHLDLRDYHNCLHCTRDMDLVIHLADIVAGINFVFDNQRFLYRANILINSNVLEAVLINKVKKYIYIGTACSYPAEKQNQIGAKPLKEEDVYPANPESAYGWSKLMGEYEAELASKESDVSVGILRLHNVYGSPCEITPERSQVIPALCRKAFNYPNEKFVVWGSGTQRRAFLHVTDAVDSIVKTIDKGIGRGPIQIGPGESHSIKEIAELISRVSKKHLTAEYDTKQPEGDKDRVADYSKAKKLLNWKPTISLDTGIKTTYEWIANELEQREIG